MSLHQLVIGCINVLRIASFACCASCSFLLKRQSNGNRHEELSYGATGRTQQYSHVERLIGADEGHRA